MRRPVVDDVHRKHVHYESQKRYCSILLKLVVFVGIVV